MRGKTESTMRPSSTKDYHPPNNGNLTNRHSSKEFINLEARVRIAEERTADLQKELQVIKEAKPLRDSLVLDLLKSNSKAERKEARNRVLLDSLRLGCEGLLSGRISVEGQVERELKERQAGFAAKIVGIETLRKELKKQKIGREDDEAKKKCCIKDEIFRQQLLTLKSEHHTIATKLEQISIEKRTLLSEVFRIQSEDVSKFNDFPILENRFLLLNLLGKGGFGEVYKAFDLDEQKYVACKFHCSKDEWTIERRESFLKRVQRETAIQRNLTHEHIVRMVDLFEVNQRTLCAVLDFCSGKDLDNFIKRRITIPEKEARSIIYQIFQGLVHLNETRPRVIHYDLKPMNILFDENGLVKVADFGLSKVVSEEVGCDGIELTSPGAGTCWYLPPECFERNPLPHISSKVDVWSAGIVFYEMLYGKRPFGHGRTARDVVKENIIGNAREINFPKKPPVSEKAKNFIKKCVTYQQEDRPDVLEAALDPYMDLSSKI